MRVRVVGLICQPWPCAHPEHFLTSGDHSRIKNCEMRPVIDVCGLKVLNRVGDADGHSSLPLTVWGIFPTTLAYPTIRRSKPNISVHILKLPTSDNSQVNTCSSLPATSFLSSPLRGHERSGFLKQQGYRFLLCSTLVPGHPSMDFVEGASGRCLSKVTGAGRGHFLEGRALPPTTLCILPVTSMPDGF